MDGTATVEADLSPGNLVDGGVLLPAALNMDSVTALQNGARLRFYRIEKEPASGQRYFVSFPSRDRSAPLLLRYSLNGVTWRPRMEAIVTDGSTLALSLSAIIESGGTDLRGCSITLAGRGSRGGDSVSAGGFPIGTLDLRPGSTVVYLLGSETAPYSSFYRWFASSRQGPHLVVAFKSPFPSVLRNLPFVMVQDSIVMSQGVIPELRPDLSAEMDGGTEDLLATFRSVVTKEDRTRALVPFNHAVTFKVRNQKDSPVVLRLYYEKKLGVRHRTEYHFAVAPNDKPGELLLWNLALPAGGEQEISFDFDSDVKSFAEYLDYDYFEGGK